MASITAVAVTKIAIMCYCQHLAFRNREYQQETCQQYATASARNMATNRFEVERFRSPPSQFRSLDLDSLGQQAKRAIMTRFD